jgi:steroid 5-alpha reductase family enzyme
MMTMSSSLQDIRLTTIVVAVTTLIIVLVVSAVQENSVELYGYSAIIYCAILSIGIQLIGWIPASIKKTERFYDIIGGFTYISVVVFSLWVGSEAESPSIREWIVSIFVIIWSLRLSFFLYRRIHRSGKDGRFDDLKTSSIRFLVPWTLQGLWVFLTLSAVIVINSQSTPAPPIGIWDYIGIFVWCIGFGIEVVADNQKTQFNSKPENKGKWISEGLWSRTRHPNYLGEILLWTGISFFGISCFTGLEKVAWISPIFVYFLLVNISGVPILEKRANEKWGDVSEYQEYRENTPKIFPNLIG